MVQQMIDSKFSGYGLANSETGLVNQDKQLTLGATPKKTALRDLQSENIITVPKSIGNSLFPKESGPTMEAVKACGTKRPAPECLVSAPHLQSLPSNASNKNLVYVRRRPEVELAKSSVCNNISNGSDCQQARKLGGKDEVTEQKSHCVPEVASIQRAALMCFSSAKPSVASSLGKSSNILQPADSNSLPISYAIPPLDYLKKMNSQHLEERYCQLQDLLKMLDKSNQADYVQMLQSLSPVDLSRHAVELEKRSIQLSLEEAKEMQRVQFLDVLGKYSKISRATSAQQGQLKK
ncbi:uncharacterized protein LOC130792727 [Actinidia eriantha]|uniref:uncharacterized protein LOC130792727 n=1 Tax=Actinidia eriantha TaxID=165200 RepID=UPI002586FFFF|nr:uncharacterized protein LOC130792727 [Actinidia eriantha]